jgi:predicted transcriptional regulator
VLERLSLKLKGKRSTSRLPDLVSLVLSRPLISIPLAAKELRVSPQAVEGMLKELGALRELTGRGRYRAWGIV